MELTVASVISALDEVVAEAPRGADTVYKVDIDPTDDQVCRYVVDGAPACIASRVLHKLGLPLVDLELFDNVYPGGVSASSSVVFNKFHSEDDIATSEALFVLRRAQTMQDDGETWGMAVHAAKQKAEEVAGVRS